MTQVACETPHTHIRTSAINTQTQTSPHHIHTHTTYSAHGGHEDHSSVSLLLLSWLSLTLASSSHGVSEGGYNSMVVVHHTHRCGADCVWLGYTSVPPQCFFQATHPHPCAECATRVMIVEGVGARVLRLCERKFCVLKLIFPFLHRSRFRFSFFEILSPMGVRTQQDQDEKKMELKCFANFKEKKKLKVGPRSVSPQCPSISAALAQVPC